MPYKNPEDRRANNSKTKDHINAMRRARYAIKKPEISERTKERAKKWVAENKDKVRAASLRHYHSLSSEEKRRRYTMGNRRKRGLTSEQYDAKLAAQNGVCSLCRKSFDLSAKGTSPSLDHNHETGRNRDFLHNNCNVAIGLLLDDPDICRLAAEYLERHKLEEGV